MPPGSKLRRLHEIRETNIAAMATWTWSKTSRHLDLVDQQLVWANRQRNESAIACLEEFRRQVVTARNRKLDAEQ